MNYLLYIQCHATFIDYWWSVSWHQKEDAVSVGGQIGWSSLSPSEVPPAPPAVVKAPWLTALQMCICVPLWVFVFVWVCASVILLSSVVVMSCFHHLKINERSTFRHLILTLISFLLYWFILTSVLFLIHLLIERQEQYITSIFTTIIVFSLIKYLKHKYKVKPSSLCCWNSTQ